ncbi:MAG TPA: serine/threonine-protein kinase [Polyangiaceae bacterium]|jgi:serine/threonine-protein kinase
MTETLALASGAPPIEWAGTIIGGKYRLERELGRGAMGTVWSAVHLTLGQRVAIKLISAEHSQSTEARQRFSTEAKAAARLKSRFVVQVYDDGETPSGTPYIVLEYLEGETLEQRLEREHTLPLNDAVRVTRHVARALSRAHAQGIVHRDLKPGNVFLTRLDEEEYGWLAKVLDFGIAKVDDLGRASTTRAGTVLGTPLFMSSEQVRGASQVDARADLYALGMVFYNMLTADYAFNGESFSDILIAICTQPLPDLRKLAPSVPASVGAWFQKACAREADDRFQSAAEMLEALEMAVGVTASGANRGPAAEAQAPMNTLHGFSPPVEHARPRGPAVTPPSTALGTQVLTSNPVNPNLAAPLNPSNVTLVDPTLRSAGAHVQAASVQAASMQAASVASGADSTFAVQHIEAPRARPRSRVWAIAAGACIAACGLGLALLWVVAPGARAISPQAPAPEPSVAPAPPSAPEPTPALAAEVPPSTPTPTPTAAVAPAALPAPAKPRVHAVPNSPKSPGNSSGSKSSPAHKAGPDMGF